MKISAVNYQKSKEAVRTYLAETLDFGVAVDIVQKAEKNAYYCVYQNGVENDPELGELPSETNGFNYHSLGHYFLCSLEGCIEFCGCFRLLDSLDVYGIVKKAETICETTMRGEA
jgi:hypothetical protein